MKNEKEMFIKNTDVKVEEGHIIVVDDNVYKVSYSNIPELVKKGIIVFKNVANEVYHPRNIFTTDYNEWWDEIISRFISNDCSRDDIIDMFEAFPGAETSLILKAMSYELNEARQEHDDATYSLSDGYYFINKFTIEPVFSQNLDVNFDEFAWFFNREDAEFAAGIIKSCYE